MELDTFTESQYKTFFAFSCQDLLAWIYCCVGSSGRGGFVSSPVTNSQYPFPIKKFIILNFHTWKLFLSNFSIVIWARPSDISQGNTQFFLGLLGLGLGFSFFRFLGLGSGLGLNKMDLAYVLSWILYEILYYTSLLHICMYLV